MYTFLASTQSKINFGPKDRKVIGFHLSHNHRTLKLLLNFTCMSLLLSLTRHIILKFTLLPTPFFSLSRNVQIFALKVLVLQNGLQATCISSFLLTLSFPPFLQGVRSPILSFFSNCYTNSPVYLQVYFNQFLLPPKTFVHVII